MSLKRRHSSREYNARWRAENREKVRARERAYYAKNREKFLTKYLLMRRRKGLLPKPAPLTQDELRKRRKAYKHRRIQAMTPEQLASEKLKKSLSNTRRYLLNREKALAYAKAWKKKNREKHLANKKRRKQVKRTRITRQLYFLQKGRCANCLKKLKEYHVDHIMPLARGGANTKENFQLLCPACNLKKSAQDPIDFARSMGRLL